MRPVCFRDPLGIGEDAPDQPPLGWSVVGGFGEKLAGLVLNHPPEDAKASHHPGGRVCRQGGNARFGVVETGAQGFEAVVQFVEPGGLRGGLVAGVVVGRHRGGVRVAADPLRLLGS